MAEHCRGPRAEGNKIKGRCVWQRAHIRGVQNHVTGFGMTRLSPGLRDVACRDEPSVVVQFADVITGSQGPNSRSG